MRDLPLETPVPRSFVIDRIEDHEMCAFEHPHAQQVKPLFIVRWYAYDPAQDT